ncbi:MAG: transposase DNA-binding-containing protein, partial [Leptolyngbyaceae cyanobacterium]
MYFQDLRHAKRLHQLIKALSHHPDESVPVATGDI